MNQPEHKTKRLAIDTLLFAISTFGSKILLFLLTPLYTAYLAAEEFGVADLITTSVNMIYPILTLAISDATLRYAIEKGTSKKAVFINSIGITIVSCLLLLAMLPLLAFVNSEITNQLYEYWGYFIAIYALFNFHNCLSNFIKGIGKTKLFAVQGIIHTVAIIASNLLFLVVFKMGLKGYLLSIVIGYIVPIALMLILADIYKYIFPLEFDKELLGDMLKYSIPMIPTLLAWTINMNINKYLLIGLLPSGEGLRENGLFSVANKIPTLLTTVLGVFTQAWQISAISNVNDNDESEYHTKVYSYIQLISLIGCMIIIPLSKILSSILFDSSYFGAWQHIPFLTFAALFSCLSGFLAAAFRAYKKTKELFVSVAIGAVFNIVLGVILINWIGVIGASIATAASFLITFIIRLINVQKIVCVRIPIIKTAISYFLVLLSCVVTTVDYKFSAVVCLICMAVILLLHIAEISKCVVGIINCFKNRNSRSSL